MKVLNLSFKKKLLFVLVCVSLILIGKYYYKKKIRQYIYQLEHEKYLSSINKIPESFWEQKYQNIQIKDKYKVVLVLYGVGEFNYGEHFKYAAEKKGWQVRLYYKNSPSLYEEEILAFDPDFILFNNQDLFFLNPRLTGHRSKKYFLSFNPMKQLFDTKRIFKKSDIPFVHHVEIGVRYANGILSSAKEIGIFKTYCQTLQKSFNGMRIFPLVPEFLHQPAVPKSIIWYGMLWQGDSRNSKQFLNFIKLLGDNTEMKVYGLFTNYPSLNHKIYDGFVPSALEMINAIRKNGIYLLTHSDSHIQSGTPSLRIFEATAANAVVISDKHPFAIEHFGDNFLYFDQNADAETMYKQVKAHYDWIKANPEKAKAMAARAHQIFLEKFTLEKDLVRIAKMHEYIVRQEKEMGLSYPLVY